MTGRARDDRIERARAVRIEDVIAQRGIPLKRVGPELVGPCPHCGGRDRFAAHLIKQLFLCRGCGARGRDAIAFVQFLDGCTFLDAVATLAGPPSDTAKETDEVRAERERLATERRERSERECRDREEREAAEAQRTLGLCNDLWARAEAPLPPEAIAYFAGRSIALDDVPDQGGLRFHPRCPFEGARTLPCVIARFTDAITNAPGGIWRRPISGLKPMALGPMKNHVIRLWDDAEITTGLCIAEGCETALAASQIAHRGAWLRPVWACGSAGNVANFPVLPGIEFLTILADADANGKGQSAARVCAKRWAAAGREVEFSIPDTLGDDFNDIVRATL